MVRWIRRSLYFCSAIAIANFLIIARMRPVSVECRVVRPTTFLVGIFSRIEDVMKRDEMRAVVFAKGGRGQVCTLTQYLRDRKMQKTCVVLYTFVIGANPSGPTVRLEQSGEPLSLHDDSQESDATLLNIKENMQDGKTQTWFTFAASLTSEYNIDYVAKMDTDTLLDVRLLIHFVETSLPPTPVNPAFDQRRRYGGLLREFNTCGSYEHCALLRGTVYMSGQFYFVSSDLALHIASNEFDGVKLRTGFEDIDFGLWVFSLLETINLVVMSGNMFWIHDSVTKTQNGLERVHKVISAGNRSLPYENEYLTQTRACIRLHGAQDCARAFHAQQHTLQSTFHTSKG
jgi:hypothetical protein